MSDDWNEAQGRINDAGANFEHLAHNQPPTMEGYALLALVDVVRQVGIEMLGVDTTIYSMEESAEELAAPETLYVGGEDVTQRYGLREDVVRAIDKGVEDGTIFADSHLPEPEPIEHYCESQRMVIPGARSKCGWDHS